MAPKGPKVTPTRMNTPVMVVRPAMNAVTFAAYLGTMRFVLTAPADSREAAPVRLVRQPPVIVARGDELWAVVSTRRPWEPFSLVKATIHSGGSPSERADAEGGARNGRWKATEQPGKRLKRIEGRVLRPVVEANPASSRGNQGPPGTVAAVASERESAEPGERLPAALWGGEPRAITPVARRVETARIATTTIATAAIRERRRERRGRGGAMGGSSEGGRGVTGGPPEMGEVGEGSGGGSVMATSTASRA